MTEATPQIPDKYKLLETAEHTVAGDDDDIRLDRWFKRHYPGFPHALLEKNLRKGLVRVDGKKAKTSDRVKAGQLIKCPSVTLEARQKRKYIPTEEELAEIKKWVLYKDENIFVLNKPFGLAVQGGSKVEKSLDDMLDGLAMDGKERPKLTHRLDRDTSGCLVLARSTKAATHLMRSFSGRDMEKTYWALVNGLPLPLEGTIDSPIGKKANPKAQGTPGGPEGRDYEIMEVDEKEGQKAFTEYRVIDQLATKFALVELKPLTGRTHQLRVHMQAIGHSIVGDHKYGGSTDALDAMGAENKLHLHARRIVIPGVNGKRIDISAPLPPHMKKTFKAIGLDVPKK